MNPTSCLLRRSAALGALLLLAAAASPLMASSGRYAADARYSVDLAPPPACREVVVARPARDCVWINGYWGWNGGRHVWISGRWVRPPWRHAAWVAPRWEHRGHRYVFFDGCWR